MRMAPAPDGLRPQRREAAQSSDGRQFWRHVGLPVLAPTLGSSCSSAPPSPPTPLAAALVGGSVGHAQDRGRAVRERQRGQENVALALGLETTLIAGLGHGGSLPAPSSDGAPDGCDDPDLPVPCPEPPGLRGCPGRQGRAAGPARTAARRPRPGILRGAVLTLAPPYFIVPLVASFGFGGPAVPGQGRHLRGLHPAGPPPTASPRACSSPSASPPRPSRCHCCWPCPPWWPYASAPHGCARSSR
ncbi:hypothetical protein SAVIM40S_01398 [Streptomyces avidinii]